jgi:hypothetical protein
VRPIGCLPKQAGTYRAWAELLKTTFEIDVLECPNCHGHMKLLAMITAGNSIERYLAKLGEATPATGRCPTQIGLLLPTRWSFAGGDLAHARGRMRAYPSAAARRA